MKTKITRRRFTGAVIAGGATLSFTSATPARAAQNVESKNENSGSAVDRLELFSPEARELHIDYGDHARELLQGAVDLHVHSSPDCFKRIFTHDEAAESARSHGLSAIVYKCHAQGVADRLPFVRKLVSGIDLLGSITLNSFVGGLNPSAVEAAIEYGAKTVWLPSIDAKAHVDHFETGTYGEFLPLAWERRVFPEPIYILNEDGRLKESMYSIMELVSAANVILNVSHVSYEEIVEILKVAKEMRFNKIVVDHPFHPFRSFSVETQLDLVSKGAIIAPTSTDLYWAEAPMPRDEFVRQIRAVGPENQILTSDGGAPGLPPCECFLGSIQLLINSGFADSEIRHMIYDKPRELIS